MKKCSKCGVEKSFREFYKIKDGIRSVCKRCMGEISKEYRITHKEELKKYLIDNKHKIKSVELNL